MGFVTDTLPRDRLLRHFHGGVTSLLSTRYLILSVVSSAQSRWRVIHCHRHQHLGIETLCPHFFVASGIA